MSHKNKMQVLKVNRLCTNCLSSGHFKNQCKSLHRCKVCQKPHHTTLHIETQSKAPHNRDAPQGDTPVGSHAATRLTSDVLLMTCRMLITAPDGSTVEVRALLDNASSASFISERLVHSHSLPRTIRVSGIGGLYHNPPIQSIIRFQLSCLQTFGRKIDVTAVVVPKVTCDLPMKPVTFEMGWMHLSDLPLANPGFGQPGRIDMLLGTDIFVKILCQPGGRVPLVHPPPLRQTLAGCSVVALDPPQLLHKPMSTSQPCTPQSYPLMTSS